MPRVFNAWPRIYHSFRTCRDLILGIFGENTWNWSRQIFFFYISTRCVHIMLRINAWMFNTLRKTKRWPTISWRHSWKSMVTARARYIPYGLRRVGSTTALTSTPKRAHIVIVRMIVRKRIGASISLEISGSRPLLRAAITLHKPLLVAIVELAQATKKCILSPSLMCPGLPVCTERAIDAFPSESE